MYYIAGESDYFMADTKYSFGAPSLMKAIEAGQKAEIKFLDLPKAVDTEWGQKYYVDILYFLTLNTPLPLLKA